MIDNIKPLWCSSVIISSMVLRSNNPRPRQAETIITSNSALSTQKELADINHMLFRASSWLDPPCWINFAVYKGN